MSEVSARAYAFSVLKKVFLEGGYAGLLMRKNNSLSKADMALVSEIVYGTIRNKSCLEYQWQPYVKKRVKPSAEILLNMSVYQLLFMDKIPAYAVIHESVDLARREEKGFINAVLRRVSDHGLMVSDDPAVVYSHPQWLLNLWEAHYGKETALQIAAHDQKPAKVYGRINSLKYSMKEAENNDDLTFCNDVSFTSSLVLAHTDLFKEGKIVIQDIHSAMVPQYLEVSAGMKVLDVCAAPGTKTQQTAAYMNNCGEITACDLYEHRVRLIEELMNRTGTDIVKTKVCDASQPRQFPDETFDRILVDAPCSGLGDLSHKPEIRWHIKPESLDEIIGTQKCILDNCAAYLKKDGILVYSTCTLNRKENEVQAKQFVKNHPEFKMTFEKTFFPFEDDGDGFYISQFRKIS